MSETRAVEADGWTVPYMQHQHLYQGRAFATVVIWPTFTEVSVHNGQSRRVGTAVFHAAEHSDHTAAAKDWARRQLANVI